MEGINTSKFTQFADKLKPQTGDQLFKFGMNSYPRYEYEIMDYK